MSLRLLVAVLAGLLVTACGIDPQAQPEELDVAPLSPAAPAPSAGGEVTELTVWFLADDRLAPVDRATSDRDARTALELLAEGPTPEEADAGLTTAVAAPALDVARDDRPGSTGDVVTVEVPPAFTGVAGDDQLRAVAQLVWTVTGVGDVAAVRFVAEGRPLEVPTDGGLTDGPVDREDYASLAPGEDAPPTGAARSGG